MFKLKEFSTKDWNGDSVIINIDSLFLAKHNNNYIKFCVFSDSKLSDFIEKTFCLLADGNWDFKMKSPRLKMESLPITLTFKGKPLKEFPSYFIANSFFFKINYAKHDGISKIAQNWEWSKTPFKHPLTTIKKILNIKEDNFEIFIQK